MTGHQCLNDVFEVWSLLAVIFAGQGSWTSRSERGVSLLEAQSSYAYDEQMYDESHGKRRQSA